MKISIAVASLMIVSAAFEIRADQVDTASCNQLSVEDQCRISWKFSRQSDSYYFVQQFDPLNASWNSLSDFSPSTLPEDKHSKPVEAGYLYRVLACDDFKATTNCKGSTMVWAAFVQPIENEHLIPSRILLVGSESRFGKPMYGLITKKQSWISQVSAYNVIQMSNAIAGAELGALPDMTPVKDIRSIGLRDPIEQVQFNVYWFYAAARGTPIDQPDLEPLVRPPHRHPEQDPAYHPVSP